MSRYLHLFCAVIVFVPAPDAFGESPDSRVYDLSYDLAIDFSADENPHGQWTFGSFNHIHTGKADDLRNLTAYGKLAFVKTDLAYSGGDLRGWGKVSFGPFSSSATGIVKNRGTASKNSIPAGSVAIFPEQGPIVVRWTAPEKGTVYVEAKFVDLTNKSGVPEVWVLQNQATANPLHYRKAYSGSGTADNHFAPAVWSTGTASRYRGTVPVGSNDTIDFVVDPMYTYFTGHSNHPEGDATDTIGLSVTINYIVDSGFTD